MNVHNFLIFVIIQKENVLTKPEFDVTSKLTFELENIVFFYTFGGKMIIQKKINVLLLLGFLLTLYNYVSSSHNASKYFPLIERSENYQHKKNPYAHASFFYATASTAFKRDGGNCGITELWGPYDLNNIFRSLEEVKGAASLTQIKTKLDSFKDRAGFDAEGKIKARGLMLHYNHPLHLWNLTVGAWLPLISINTTGRFTPADQALSSDEQVRLNEIRRDIHNILGLCENNWDKGGLGDIDVYLRWSHQFKHKLMMRSISLNLQLGCLIPTGIDTDINHFSSAPVMGNGHWGLYADLSPEFELKQNLKVGLILSAMYQFKNTKKTRIPVYNEPTIFSPLIGQVSIDPGMTFKISPYIILENLTDGIHFQARYTYLRHNSDTWRGISCDCLSYLTRKPTEDITQEHINCNIRNKKRLSEWRSHYITLQFLYNSKDALHNIPLDPNIYVMYDIPMNGRGMSKTHQISLGIELHF